MSKQERYKLSEAQKEAIDEYNTNRPKSEKVNKHYSAERAQWLNDNIFGPARLELVPIRSEDKIKKAQRDAQRSSQPTTSTHSMSGRKLPSAPRRSDAEGISFNVSVARGSFTVPIKEVVDDQLEELKQELFTKDDGKKLMKEFDERLEHFGQELSSSITKSIATLLVSTQQ